MQKLQDILLIIFNIFSYFKGKQSAKNEYENTDLKAQNDNLKKIIKTNKKVKRNKSFADNTDFLLRKRKDSKN